MFLFIPPCVSCRGGLAIFTHTRPQSIRDGMDAREIESLSMISRGFEELRDVNPEMAYNVIVDILSGINE